MAYVKNYNHKKKNNNNGIPKPRSCNNRSNYSSVNGRQLSAHQLENKFCRMVGGVSWKHVIENQKYMYLYDKIIKWEDSAVEEAYWDAKTRFLAEVHGEPCDVELPDPDIFNDKIDWDAAVDPGLLSDLDNKAVVKQDDIGGVIIEIPPTVIESDLTPNGWGDAENVKPQQEVWDDNVIVKREDQGFSNNYVYATQDTSRDQENRINGSTWNSYRRKPQYYYENGNGWHLDRKEDGGGWNTSRYKISRYQHNNNSWPFDNFGRRKRNLYCQRPLMAWKPVTRCQ
ncbi:uncharacterized protein LOC141627821 [Silene latifolia]|uniref:uncharacterized protein LOC141627821 n=1 Tax=Silene latifolia TaxID=37657 RepID=UPI003D773B0A